MEKGPEGPAHPLLRLRMCHNVVRALPYDRRLRRPGHAHGRHQPYVGHRALRASLSSRPAHAGTAEPLRVSPPEAVAYLLEIYADRIMGAYYVIESNDFPTPYIDLLYLSA